VSKHTTPKPRRVKSPKPRRAKVKAVRAWAGIVNNGWGEPTIDQFGESTAWGQGDKFTIKWGAAVYFRQKAAKAAYMATAPVTIIPGHIGKDFTITPLPRSRK